MADRDGELRSGEKGSDVTPEQIQELAKKIKVGIKNPEFINLARLNLEVEDAMERAKKMALEANLEKAKKVLSSIASGKKLTQKEKNLIRDIIVGDAERYVEEEEGIEEKMEYLMRASKRLMEMAETEKPEAEKLGAVLWEVNMTLNSVAGYFEAKERVEKFRSAFSDLDDPAQRKLLFEMMNSRLGINLF